MAGGALREGQYIRRLARWLANNPAETGLPYPELVGGSRDDVSLFLSVLSVVYIPCKHVVGWLHPTHVGTHERVTAVRVLVSTVCLWFLS